MPECDSAWRRLAAGSIGGRRGVFLPGVWEAVPAPADFINQLKVKAGQPADHWSGDIKASRFTAAATSFSKLNSVH